MQHITRKPTRKPDWSEVHKAIQFKNQGLNISQIARLMGKHRTQVQRYIAYSKRNTFGHETVEKSS